MPLNFHRSRDFLCNFDFHGLFIQELGWNQPSSSRAESVVVEDITYDRKRIAEMSGVPIFEITAPDGEIPPGAVRLKIYKEISAGVSLENLLIFVNGDRTAPCGTGPSEKGRRSIPARTLTSRGSR